MKSNNEALHYVQNQDFYKLQAHKLLLIFIKAEHV